MKKRLMPGFAILILASMIAESCAPGWRVRRHERRVHKHHKEVIIIKK